jgi:hypothetical protein
LQPAQQNAGRADEIRDPEVRMSKVGAPTSRGCFLCINVVLFYSSTFSRTLARSLSRGAVSHRRLHADLPARACLIGTLQPHDCCVVRARIWVACGCAVAVWLQMYCGVSLRLRVYVRVRAVMWTVWHPKPQRKGERDREDNDASGRVALH